MGVARNLLRQEAKKLYKEQSKGVPKSRRIPFSEFYKQYKILKAREDELKAHPDHTDGEDFDFEDLVNVNEISDEDLVTETVVEDTEEEDQ